MINKMTGNIEEKKILYIDLDDTICDFSTAYTESKTKYPDVIYPQSQYGFFINLNPMEGAIEAVNKLRTKFDVYILTRPSYMNPLCYTEKRLWIEKHFDLSFCENLILCSKKHLLKGDYLIDDVSWPLFEGKQILFGSTDNGNCPDWISVLNYFNL
jgi:5'-nucleotidase